MRQPERRQGSTYPLDDRASARYSRVLRGLLGRLRRRGFDYSCFKIFSLSLDADAASSAPSLPLGYRFAAIHAQDLIACPFEELRESASYGGPDSRAFGIFREDGPLVCAQWFWFGERYRLHAFWPVGTDDAVSMHLVTAASERGKGLATGLKKLSALQLRAEGFSRLYSRVWWTNLPSIRTNEKAGWAKVGTVLEISLPFLRSPLRIVRTRRSH